MMFLNWNLNMEPLLSQNVVLLVTELKKTTQYTSHHFVTPLAIILLYKDYCAAVKENVTQSRN